MSGVASAITTIVRVIFFVPISVDNVKAEALFERRCFQVETKLNGNTANLTRSCIQSGLLIKRRLSCLVFPFVHPRLFI